MALDPNNYQNPKLYYHDRGVSPSNFPRNSGTESHRWFSPQEDMENKDFHGKGLGMPDASFESVGFADLSDRGVLKERNRNNFGSRERKSHDSGRESHCLFTPQVNMENKGFHGKELGISDSSFASIGRGELSDRGVLRNNNYFESKERKSHNSGMHLGSFSYGDRPKHHRIRSEEDLRGFECQCDLGSTCKTNSDTNRSSGEIFHGVGDDINLSTVAPEDIIGNKSILEKNSRPLCRVASEGNLNELAYNSKFGSSIEHRSISPKVRTSLAPAVVSDSSETKRCGCVHELFSDRKDTQTHLSPNYGLYFSPNKNTSSYKSKPSYTPRMDYLSPRRQCLCYKPKSQKRDEYSSPSFQEKFIKQSLSNEPERKVNSGSKGKSGLYGICASAILGVLLVIVFLSAPMKEISFLRPQFGARNCSLGTNHICLFLNRVGLGSNYSEGVNSEREIEPSIEKGGCCRGEIEKGMESLTLNETSTEKVQTLEEPDFIELPKEEKDGHEELKSESREKFKIENTKQCGLLDFNAVGLAQIQDDINDTIEDRKVQTFEETDFTKPPEEEEDGHEELQSVSKDELKIENTKQCEVIDFTADRLEGPIFVPDRKIGYVALVQADADNIVEDKKLEMRITFCMAFVSVAMCASMVSCIVNREQFSEMLYRYYSSKKGRKNSKKEPRRESSVVLEGSYGSIVTYEKIPAKKRGGQKDGLLTPVRRSSRIRNYLASPS